MAEDCARTWTPREPLPEQADIRMRRWKGSLHDLATIFDIVVGAVTAPNVSAEIVKTRRGGEASYDYYYGAGDRDAWLRDVVLGRDEVDGFSVTGTTAILPVPTDPASLAESMPADLLASIAQQRQVVITVRWNRAGPGVAARIDGEASLVDAVAPRLRAALGDGRRVSDAHPAVWSAAAATAAAVVSVAIALTRGGMSATRAGVAAGFAVTAATFAYAAAGHLFPPVEILHRTTRSRAQRFGGLLYGTVSLVLGIVGVGLTLEAPPPNGGRQPDRTEPTRSFDPRTPAWGPTRPIYRCDLAGQCKSANHVTLDSAIGNPAVQDERHFVAGRRVGSLGPSADRVDVGPGDKVVIRIFVANNGPIHSSTRRLRARVELPPVAAHRHRIYGWLSADNAAPKEVYDAMELRATTPVKIKATPSSARLTNRAHPRGLRLADTIVGPGVTLGYRRLDGRISGCPCQSGYVTLRLRVERG